MHLRRLHVQQAPGLDSGLPPIELSAGLTVVVGPNGSGKSTLAKAVRALLWADGPETRGLRATSSWQSSEHACSAELFGGRVQWDPAPAVVAPVGAVGLARLGMRSLLSEDGDADRALAQRLLRELSGGLDLRAAQAVFDRPPRLSPANRLARQLKDARAAYRQAIGAADSLAAREEQRASLEARIAEVRSAGDRHTLWTLLAERQQADEVLRDLDARLEAFEPGLESLREEDSRVLEELQGERDAAQAERQRWADQLEQHQSILQAQVFPASSEAGESLGPEQLEAWAGRLDRLAQQERRLADQEAELAGARQRLRLARQQLGGDPEGVPETGIPAEALEQLAEALQEVRLRRGALEAERQAVQAWQRWASADPANEDGNRLPRAIDDLRAWMRAPDGEPGQSRPGADERRRALLLIAAGALAVLLAVVLERPWLSFLSVLAGLGGGLLWATAGRGSQGQLAHDPAMQRALLRRRLEPSGLAPADWEMETVSEHLERLEDRLVERQLLERAQQRLEDARAQAQRAEQRWTEGKDELLQQAAQAGVSADFAEPELSAMAQAQVLARWLEAQARCASLEASLRESVQQVQAGLERCADWLEEYGEGDVLRDVAAAQAALRQVEARRRAVEEARAGIIGAGREVQDAQARLDDLERKLSAFWERVGAEPGDRVALDRRLASVPAWRNLREQRLQSVATRKAADERFQRRWHELRDDPELAEVQPDVLNSAQVEEWIQQTDEQARRLNELFADRVRLDADLDHAGQGQGLSDALAALHATERAVADERERATEDALARQLLEEAQDSHESSHTPPVLKRAQALLAHFTHHSWRLEVDAEGHFHAVEESSGRARSLGELSDGTRTQLLLAARIAALEQLEAGGAPVPLCLDEALANSDPVRFRAVAGALLELSDGGRQVLYFTADPGEAEQWAQACRELGHAEPARVDLGVLRGESADWGGSLPATPEPSSSAPEPAGLSPAQYAERIGAARPDGFQPVESWHLYTLAHDQLPALASCLDHRLARVGQWRAARRDAALPPGIDEATAVAFDARAQLALALSVHWRQGRGRPVQWQDVESSGAVSDKFQERVLEVLREHGRDAGRFLEAVGSLKGFRSNKLEELRESLLAAGCLSTEEVLAPDERVRRTLADAAPAIEVLGAREAAAYLDWLGRLLDGEAGAAAG